MAKKINLDDYHFDHDEAVKILANRILDDKDRNAVPILDEMGVFTGETYDQREGQAQGQPSSMRLKDYLEQSGIQPRTGQPIQGFDPIDPFASEGLGSSLKNISKEALNESAVGLVWELIADEKIFPEMRQWQRSDIEQFASGIGALVADIPLFAVGSGIGGAVGKQIAKNVVKDVAKKAITNVTGQMGAFGVHSGARNALEQKLHTGEVDLGQVAEKTAKGAALGAVVGGTASAIPKVIKGSTKLGSLAQLGGEVTAFGTAMPVIEEGRAPNKEDYVEAAKFILGMRTAMGLAKAPFKARDYFKKAKEIQDKVENPDKIQTPEEKAQEFNTLVDLEGQRMTSGLVGGKPSLALKKVLSARFEETPKEIQELRDKMESQPDKVFDAKKSAEAMEYGLVELERLRKSPQGKELLNAYFRELESQNPELPPYIRSVAEELAKLEYLRQSPKGRILLKEQLRKEEIKSQETTATVRNTPAEQSAKVLESEIGRAEQLNKSVIGKEGLAKKLREQEKGEPPKAPQLVLESKTKPTEPIPEPKAEPKSPAVEKPQEIAERLGIEFKGEYDTGQGKPKIYEFRDPESKANITLRDLTQLESKLKEKRQGAKVKPPEITYEEFSKAYEDAFNKSMKYEIDQAGSKIYTEKMADLADAYPEYLKKFEAEVEAKAFKPTEKPADKAPEKVEPMMERGKRAAKKYEWALTEQELYEQSKKYKTSDDFYFALEKKFNSIPKEEQIGLPRWHQNLTRDEFSNLAESLGIEKKVEPVKKPVEKKQEGVTTRKLEEIELDTKRFQNRKAERSEETVSAIVSEGFDPVKWKPIVVWKDPKNGKTYLVEGHSRYEAMKRLGRKDIEVVEFKGTEKEAILHGKVESNRTSTKETLLEDIEAYKIAKDGGYSKEKLENTFGKKNIADLEAYSYLNPNGKFMTSLQTKGTSEAPHISRWTKNVGDLRKEYPKLNNRHEDQIFDQLYPADKGKGLYDKMTKDELFDVVGKQAGDMFFDPNKPIKLKNVRKEGTIVTDTPEIRQAKARIKEIEAEMERNRKLAEDKNSSYTKQQLQRDNTALKIEKDKLIRDVGKFNNEQTDIFSTPKETRTDDVNKKVGHKVADRELNKQIFGGTENKNVKVSEITKSGKKVLRINEAGSFNDVMEVYNYGKKNGYNTYLNVFFEKTNSSMFSVLQGMGMIGKKVGKRYRLQDPKDSGGDGNYLVKPDPKDPNTFGGLSAWQTRDKGLTTQIGEKATSFWETTKRVFRTILPFEKRVKQEESKKVIGWVEDAEALRHQYHAKWAEVLLEQLKWKSNMSRAESAEMYRKFINGESVEWISLMNLVRGNYNYVVEKFTNNKNMLLGKVENYFPRKLKREVQEKIQQGIAEVKRFLDEKTIKNTSDEVLASIIQSKALRKQGYRLSKDVEGFEGKAVLEAAIESLRKQSLKETGKPLSLREALMNLEREFNSDLFMSVSYTKRRTLELPSSFYETDVRVVVPEYLQAMARRVAEIEVFGPNSEKLLSQLAKLEKKDYQEYKLMREAITKWSGVFNQKHAPRGTLKSAVDWFVASQVATKIGLGRATFLNFTQWAISFMPRLGFYNTLRGAMDIMKPEQRKRIKKAGVVDLYDQAAIQAMVGDVPGGLAGRLSNFTTKWSGFSGVNRMNLYWASATFMRAVKQWVPQARGEGRLAELRRKQLKDFGIDYKKDLTPAEMQRKMFTFATNSQLLKNVLKEPLFFNDPRLAPLFLFKRFGYRQAAMMGEMLTKEIKRGNVAPLIRLMIAGYGGGTMALWGLDKLKEMLSGEPSYQTEDRYWRKAIDNISVIGAFGMVGDMVELKKASDLANKLKFTLYPVVVSDIEKVMDTYTKVTEDWERYGDGWLATKRNAYRTFGFFGSYPNYASKRLKTVGQKEAGVRFLKGRERSEIFDLMLNGRAESAKKRIELWNKNHPDNPLTFNDVSIRALTKYLKNKLEAKVGVDYKEGTPEFKRKVREGLPEVREQVRAIRNRGNQ